MNKYLEIKEKLREEAKEWQSDFQNNNFSFGDVAYYTNYFYKKGKKYGLLKEFKENGII